MWKLARPNQGPYRITETYSTGVLIVPESRVNWERLRKCPETLQIEVVPVVDTPVEEEDAAPDESWKSRLRPRVRKLIHIDEDIESWKGEM